VLFLGYYSDPNPHFDLQRARNNQNYYSQIAHHLDCAEKCIHFDLATRILSLHTDVGDVGEEGKDHEHEPKPKEETDNLHPSPTHRVINYFDIASSLSNGDFPDSPRPFRSLQPLQLI